MRIESKGIVIREIFINSDEGEQIEISADGKNVTLTLKNENGTNDYTYSAKYFRELLAAINTAHQEIFNIEHPTEAA